MADSQFWPIGNVTDRKRSVNPISLGWPLDISSISHRSKVIQASCPDKIYRLGLNSGRLLQSLAYTKVVNKVRQQTSRHSFIGFKQIFISSDRQLVVVYISSTLENKIYWFY